METIGANVFVETVYPGINVGCILTDDGAVCVDTPLLPGEAQRWMARIRALGTDLVRFIVYTSGQSERILGTQYFLGEREAPLAAQAESTRLASRPRLIPFRRPSIPKVPEDERKIEIGTVVAHELAWEQVMEHRADSFKQSMIDTFGDRDPDMDDLEVVLPHITAAENIQLFVGGATIELLAAVGGVLWVWFLEGRVLFVGDTLVVGTHPPLTAMELREWLDALEKLRQDPRFQDAIIVPGRGPLCDVSAVPPVLDYLHRAFEETHRVYQAGRAKAELNEVAAELVPLFPVADGQRERVQRQIKMGLDKLFDELKSEDSTTEN